MPTDTPPSEQPPASQPSWVAWSAVAVGDSMPDVEARLGEPLERHEDAGEVTLVFGRIRVPGFIDESMGVDLGQLEYLVAFGSDGAVEAKYEPFEGSLTADGRPAAPILLAPTDGQDLSAYPRAVDVRWNPVGGAYPMRYVLTVRDRVGDREFETIETAMTVVLLSMGSHQVRVSAISAIGAQRDSEWVRFCQSL